MSKRILAAAACTLVLMRPLAAQAWIPLRPAPDSLRATAPASLRFFAANDTVPFRWFAVALLDVVTEPSHLSPADSTSIREGAFGFGANGVILRTGPKGWEAAAIWMGRELVQQPAPPPPQTPPAVRWSATPPDRSTIVWPQGAIALCKDGSFDTGGEMEGCGNHGGLEYWRDPVAAARQAVASQRQYSADSAAVMRRLRDERSLRRLEFRALGWSEAVIAAVLDGRIRIGMTPAQVIASWGRPNDVNTTISRRGRFEQWVYGYSSYVYFENGRVAVIQN